MLIGVIAEELLLPQTAFTFVVDVDTVPSPTISVPGFLLFEGSFDADDAIYAAFVGNVANSIYPPMLVDPDTFYAFTSAKITTISPAFFRDDLTDVIPSPTVISKVLGPLLFVDDDLFGGTRKITQGKATINQSTTVDPVFDLDIIFGPLVERPGVTLIPRQAALATETDIVYINETTASDALLASFVHEAATFTAPPLGYLTPNAVAADDVFLAQDVLGSLGASLFTDTDVFFVPSQGNYARPSAVFVDSDVVFTPSVARQLRPSTVVDSDVFNGPSFTQPGSLALVIDAAEAIFAATIVGTPALAPTDAIIDLSDTFFAPSIALTNKELTPHFWPDIDNVLAPSVTIGQGLQPGVATDADAFFAPSVVVGAVSLLASLVTDTDAFYVPIITQTGFDGILALDGPIGPAATQPTVIFVEG